MTDYRDAVARRAPAITRDGQGNPRSLGRVIAYTDEPQVCIERPDGRKEWWLARLTDVTPGTDAQAAQDRPGRHETPSARGRDGADAPDAATGHQRVERCECGHTKHDHRWGWNARLYGTCPISGCPCDDYATQEEPRP